MKNPLKKTLFAALIFFSIVGASADEQCRLVIGQTCSGEEVFVMNFNRGTNSTNRARCESLPTICKLNQFQPWIDSFKVSRESRHGIGGRLDNSDAVDDQGRMLMVADKFVTKCFKVRRNGGAWEHKGTVRCEKSDTVCSGGLVWNPSSSVCEAHAPSGETDGGDASGAFSLGYQMLQQQQNHFAGGNEIDPNLQQLHAVGGTAMEGMIDPNTLSRNAANGNPNLRLPPTRSRAFTGSPNTDFGSPAMATTAESDTEPSTNAATANGPQLASATPGEEIGKANGYAAGSGTGAASGGNSNRGPSWFGSADSATAGVSSGEAEFSGSGASRDLASSGMLSIEDPADYFLRSDMDVSLFKRVTAQCRKKEKDWVLAP